MFTTTPIGSYRLVLDMGFASPTSTPSVAEDRGCRAKSLAEVPSPMLRQSRRQQGLGLAQQVDQLMGTRSLLAAAQRGVLAVQPGLNKRSSSPPQGLDPRAPPPWREPLTCTFANGSRVTHRV
jgi:hypothetical protein